MDKKQKILELRGRLDKTLAMPDLVNEESIKFLVKDQLLRSSFCGNEEYIGNVVEKRTKEVSNFLEMLRSASPNGPKTLKNPSYNEWKVKQDTDQLRVMYREGLHGSPFHTLLAEGYADGPLDVCLCVSWETTLYRKWWPQYNIPTFKITSSTCLQKVCIGEEISLLRVKVAWPVSDREALLHYFEIEYFKEDLVIILLNTISDAEHIDVRTHGFTKDGIPEAKDTVRIDLVGGFVLQKVDANKSYFRAIANMDIKLDFIPPTLINFISRQLIGNGHKLYQKAVGSVATSDEDYMQALQGALYTRIREGLESNRKHRPTFVESEEEKYTALSLEEHQNSNPSLIEIRPTSEIVEEKNEPNLTGSSINQLEPTEEHLSTESSCMSPEQNLGSSLANVIRPTSENASKENAFVSPEVERALRTLDQAIAIVRNRGRGFSDSNQSDCFSINQEIATSKAVENSRSISNEDAPKNCTDGGTKPSTGVHFSSTSENSRDGKTDFAHKGGDSRDQRDHRPSEERIVASYEKLTAEGTVTMSRPPVSESMRKVCDEESLRANGYHQSGSHHGPNSKSSFKQDSKKKHRFPCCINLRFFQS